MNRLQIALFLCALLLSMVLWHEPSPAPSTRQHLSELQASSVNRIALYIGDQAAPSIQLQRDEGQWLLHQPLRAQADPMSVHELLRLTEATSHVQRPASSLDLGALKLQPPLWRVRFNELALDIGGVERISRRRYVRIGDTVHLVADFNPAILDNNYADLVHRNLLPAGTEILRMQTSQDRDARPAAQVGTLLDSWQQARADWIIRPLPIHFASVHDRVRIHARSGTIEYLVAGRSPKLQLIRPDWDLLYVLPGSAADELLPAD